MSSVQIVRGDARRLPLADNTVDLVVTSPPYFALRSYTDDGVHFANQIGSESTPAEWLAALLEVTAECVRVLKPSGSLFVNLGDKYSGNTAPSRHGQGATGLQDYGAKTVRIGVGDKQIRREITTPAKSLMGLPWRYTLACIDQLGLILRAEIVWAKPNGLPESVTDRVRRSHEQWFHFVLQPRYYSAVDEIREAHAQRTIEQHAIDVRAGVGESVSQYRSADGYGRRGRSHTPEPNPLGKLPGSVWTIPSEPLTVPPGLGVDHFAAFPLAWPRRIIAAWCPPGGLCLDPFGGTGTTALAALALGRNAVHVDLSADYNRIAAWRTSDRDQLAKAMQVTRDERARDNDLYDVQPLFEVGA